MQMVLKRLALAAVSDKRVRETVLAILLGFLLFAVMPVFSVVFRKNSITVFRKNKILFFHCE